MEVSGRRRFPPMAIDGLLVVFMWMLILIHSSSVCLAEKTHIRSISWMAKSRALTAPNPLKLEKNESHVVMDNGILQVTLAIPDGNVDGVRFNGIENVLSATNGRSDRGYWDVVWNNPGVDILVDRCNCMEFKIIAEEPNQIEVSFTKTSTGTNTAPGDTNAPINIDKRFVMLPGESGFYSYAIFERHEGCAELAMDQIRIVYKLHETLFRSMRVSDDMNRIMPSEDDRKNGKELDYPEAVLVTDPSDPSLLEVDDKYQYSQDHDTRVHGWTCNDPPVGFWIITPSDEYRTAGPTKQELTSHAGPIALSMFGSTHYAGKDAGMKFVKGELWKKVFGPVFMYVNTNPQPEGLWEDAKRQLNDEIQKWPYTFPKSIDFVQADQRGGVDGQLLVNDKFINEQLIPASNASIGLAALGEAGSWQTESKGYQFWTQACPEGRFSIKNVLPGDYNLYAFVPGFIGDYKHPDTVTIAPGRIVNLPNLEYSPPRSGPTLWEIGVPDRSAAEFHVPDPPPDLVNRLFVNLPANRYRQYGLWRRYTELYPDTDLSFKVGVDDPAKNWFFAQVTRDMGNSVYKSTTWSILFDLQDVPPNGNYTLQLALAAATGANLQVRINNLEATKPTFGTATFGKDNAIARHGIHGLYWLYSASIPSSELVMGSNTIFLTQAKNDSQFQGIMYDYIRLEGPTV